MKFVFDISATTVENRTMRKIKYISQEKAPVKDELNNAKTDNMINNRDKRVHYLNNENTVWETNTRWLVKRIKQNNTKILKRE